MRYAGRDDVLVLALPRGGVPVGFEVASLLGVPLDVFVVRKLGVPGNEELALGAIASGGVRFLNDHIARLFPFHVIEAAARHEMDELLRREHRYRGDRPFPILRGRTLLLVDDGLATGASMLAAVSAVRQHAPAEMVVAVPVAPPDAMRAFDARDVQVVCPFFPENFLSVGQWYDDFSQTSDEEVCELFSRAAGHV